MIHPYQPASTKEIELARQWLEAKIQDDVDLGPGIPLLFMEEGNTILCCAYWHAFSRHDVQLSFAATNPRWATKGNIKLIISYPFITWPEKLRVSSIVSRKNHRVRKLLKGVGFRHEGTHPAVFGQTAALSFGLTREQWLSSRWGPSSGQISTIAA